MLSNSKIRREMLTLLIEKMLMHLKNPLVTADFLMNSMDTRKFYFLYFLNDNFIFFIKFFLIYFIK
jgi:hypothetical protein